MLSPNAVLSIHNDFELTDSITAKENNELNLWATRVYQGDKITLLLVVPDNEIGKNTINISIVNYGIKGYGGDFGSPGNSASCNINVACSQGNGWENERKAVSILLVNNGQGTCTGTLVMNTCNTNAPYVLTADHCLVGNLANWVFQFKYWSETCSPNSGWSEDIQFNGCTLRANNSATDFALVEMSTTPSPSSDIYYAGWSRENTGITNTTVLHHPRSDLMKIAIDNGTPSSVTDVNGGVSRSCWELDLDFGIVQQGSSGAAYFNQNHRVIGQHYRRPEFGSVPECDISIIIGGRFDQSWTGGGTNATRLSNWLDPTNTGATTTNTTNISNLDPSNFAHVTMTGDATICGSAKTYSLSGSLSGLPVNWSASNSYIILSGSGSSITATPASGVHGYVTLTATIGAAGCHTNNVKTKLIHVGTPVAGFNIESYPYEEPSCYSEWGIYTFRATNAWGAGSTGHEWGYRLIGSPPDVISPYDSPYFTFIPEQIGSYEIFVRPKNECGTGTYESIKEIEVVYSCPFRLTAPGRPKPLLFPNPVKGDEVTVLLNGNHKELPADKSKAVNGRIRIESLDGRLLSETAFDAHAVQVKLNVAKLRSGIYIVRIIRGTETDTQKLVVQK